MIAQTAVFIGTAPGELYRSFLSAADHAAMTADGGRPATFVRGDVAVPTGEEGDELRAVGVRSPDGGMLFSVEAQIVKLLPDRMIVMAWKNVGWRLAVDRTEVTDER
jgi:hypothetical protein